MGNSMGSSGDFKGFEWNSKVILRDITGLESEREFLWDFDGIYGGFLNGILIVGF